MLKQNRSAYLNNTDQYKNHSNTATLTWQQNNESDQTINDNKQCRDNTIREKIKQQTRSPITQTFIHTYVHIRLRGPQ